MRPFIRGWRKSKSFFLVLLSIAWLICMKKSWHVLSLLGNNGRMWLPSLEEWQQFHLGYTQRFGRKPPHSFQNWLAFAKDHKCEEQNFYDGLERDMLVFRELINSTGRLFKKEDVVPFGLSRTDNYIALSLENHNISVIASRNVHDDQKEQDGIEKFLRWLLEPVARHVPPLNATYFFHLHDSGTPGISRRTIVPLFSVCKMNYFTDNEPPPIHRPNFQDNVEGFNLHNSKLFRQSDSFDLMVPYYNAFAHVKLTKNPFPRRFLKRKDAILWRGSTTGEWGVAPRFKLISEFGGSEVHPIAPNVSVLADFAFSKILQDDNGKKTLAPNSRLANHKYYFQMQNHKYILDIDGNAFTARFPELLKLGSVVLKSTRYREWYTERLRPYVDYVPVNYNLSDLIEKVSWLHNHPKIAQQIAHHSKQTVTHYIRPEDMQCYTYRMMLEYQTLFE